jgi:hypothetical protein
MITKIEALELVSKKLRQMSPAADPFVPVEASTIERSFGWVFFYNSRKFLETGVTRYRLAGNGPIIVNKVSGEIVFCGSNKPPEELINDYETKFVNGEA